MASDFVNNTNSKNPLDYITSEIEDHFAPALTDLSEILKLIANLKDKKASGYDAISNKILKSTRNVIAPYIVVLFNNCIRMGVFPE